MSNLSYIFHIILCVTLSTSCGCRQQNNLLESAHRSSDKNAGCVYVCNGKYAKRYHRTRYCSGLNNCQGGVVEMPIEDAEARGLTPCRKCY